MFRRERLEAAAGVKQPIVAFAKEHPDTRVIPGRFMVIEQAMGTSKGRDAGTRYLREFIEEMKTSGFVARALSASGQTDAAVARSAGQVIGGSRLGSFDSGASRPHASSGFVERIGAQPVRAQGSLSYSR